MENLFAFVISIVFVNNIVLTKFLGFCPFLSMSKKTSHSLGFGAGAIFIMTFASILSWFFYNFILVPLKIEFLYIISLIFIILLLVELLNVIVRKFANKLYFGKYFPVLTTNCAILGIVFFNVQEQYSLSTSIIYSISAGVGFTIALLFMSSIREKIEQLDIPEPFKGMPITFIAASIISMAFTGFG